LSEGELAEGKTREEWAVSVEGSSLKKMGGLGAGRMKKETKRGRIG